MTILFDRVVLVFGVSVASLGLACAVAPVATEQVIVAAVRALGLW